MSDPYTILGVPRGANEAEIKSAYRKLAKELHPDKNQDNPSATERFSTVTRAYDLLSDKDKRARFDRGEIDVDGNPRMPFGGGGGGGYRPGGPGGPQPGFNGEEVDLGDLFEGLFGRGGAPRGGAAGFGRRPPPPPPRRGANIGYTLRVPFTDAALLAEQRITLGDGKTIDLKLPAGLEEGTQMRLKGKGEPGPGGAGDALVTIAIEAHGFFRRDGDDVLLDLPVTLDEAVNGAKVKAPTVDGPVMLTIAPGSGSGKVLRLKGRGFSKKGGERGDQRVTLEIHLPEDIADLAAQLEGWRDQTDVRQRFGLS